jgi:hypothetical protein
MNYRTWTISELFPKFSGESGGRRPINDKWQGLAVVVLTQREEYASGCHLSSAIFGQNSSGAGNGCEIGLTHISSHSDQISGRRLYV